MARFQQSSTALEQYEAHIPKHFGIHELQRQAVSVGGLDMGSVDFDPIKHMPHMIDPLSVLESVNDSQQVRIQKPHNPMLINIIGDYRFNGDLSSVADMKKTALDSILTGLTDSVPALDRRSILTVENDGDEADLELDDSIVDEASIGLSMIAGDFRTFNPRNRIQDCEVVAVKVNHPLEIALPPNVGRLPVGGLLEVNTNSPTKLAEFNDMLDRNNDAIVTRLKNLGMVVAEVVLDPHAEGYIDTESADIAIAEAISSIAR